MPRSLSEALHEAERAELVLSSQPNQQRALTRHPYVRAADCEEQEEIVEVSQLQPRAVRRRSRRQTDRCFRCDEPGHVARDCPAPTPKARATQPQGNDGGVA